MHEMDKIRCVWEHNGNDTLLYAVDYPGAYARGCCLQEAVEKMRTEIPAFCTWACIPAPALCEIEISQDASCELQVRDADSDVLFTWERDPLSLEEYNHLKELALHSAEDFLNLYTSIPDKNRAARPNRTTFYGAVPRTADEMYLHTKNVNAYYFGEIGVDADNEGTIVMCRARGFAALEQQPDYLTRPAQEGSYDEWWSLRKMLRRFLWHDRIHAKAMYRMTKRNSMVDNIADPFRFDSNM